VSAIGKVVSIVPGSNFNTDLALIVCDAPKGIQALPVAKFNKHTGPWRSIGFRYSVMYESIALEAEEAAGLIQVSEPYIKGMSGGPVLDGSGAVVGVVVGTDSMPGSAVGRSFGLAANGEYLAALIAAHSE
jgi:hypothetical protein